jgi:type IV pilus assembly protein PilB
MRKVCPHCATQRPATDRELELLGAAPGTQVMLREGAGCHNCNQTGYKNRLSIHEVLVADAEVKRMVADHASSADIRAYARSKQGMKTLQEEAAAAVLAGQTTMEEFLKIAYQA